MGNSSPTLVISADAYHNRLGPTTVPVENPLSGVQVALVRPCTPTHEPNLVTKPAT